MAGHRINQRTLARGGVRAGSDASNYTDINSGGYQTMSGCGRAWDAIDLSAGHWYGSNSASTHALSGSVYLPIGAAACGGYFEVPTWSPSSTTCNMNIDAAVFAPPNVAATGGSMKLLFNMITNTDMTAASTVGVRVNWDYINGVGTCGVKSGSAEYAASTLSASAKGTHFQFGLNTCLPSFDQVGQLLLLHLQMITGTCSAGVNMDFVGAQLFYLADRLGASGA